MDKAKWHAETLRDGCLLEESLVDSAVLMSVSRDTPEESMNNSPCISESWLDLRAETPHSDDESTIEADTIEDQETEETEETEAEKEAEHLQETLSTFLHNTQTKNPRRARRNRLSGPATAAQTFRIVSETELTAWHCRTNTTDAADTTDVLDNSPDIPSSSASSASSASSNYLSFGRLRPSRDPQNRPKRSPRLPRRIVVEFSPTQIAAGIVGVSLLLAAAAAAGFSVGRHGIFQLRLVVADVAQCFRCATLAGRQTRGSDRLIGFSSRTPLFAAPAVL